MNLLASNESFQKLFLPALPTIYHIKPLFNLSLHCLTFCSVCEYLVLHSYQSDYVEFQFFPAKSHFVTAESGCLFISAVQTYQSDLDLMLGQKLY
jgi:hypothetical protein